MRKAIGVFAVAFAILAMHHPAQAQSTAMPVIGWLNGQPHNQLYRKFVSGFLRGLGEAGFVDGRNVAIEWRWANNDFDRLPALAADLIDRQVAVIVAGGGNTPAKVAKAATKTIPIVSTFGGDPVKRGLVDSLAKPGGNLTGASLFIGNIDPKRLELMKELAPSGTALGYLADRSLQFKHRLDPKLRAVSRKLGIQLHIAEASTRGAIDAAFTTLVEKRIGGLVVGGMPFFLARRHQIIALSSRHAVPAIYNSRTYVEAGGLISYGSDISDVYRQLGNLAGAILKGADPANLPVRLPTKFDLVINLKTAKTLGIKIPRSVMLRATELIE